MLGTELTNNNITFEVNRGNNPRAIKLVIENEGYRYKFLETMNNGQLTIYREIQNLAHSIIKMMLGAVNRVCDNITLTMGDERLVTIFIVKKC